MEGMGEVLNRGEGMGMGGRIGEEWTSTASLNPYHTQKHYIYVDHL